jgi:hypothetical protein
MSNLFYFELYKYNLVAQTFSQNRYKKKGCNKELKEQHKFKN